MPTGPTRSPAPRPIADDHYNSNAVRLEVPAEARFARVVRVAVSAAAVHCGLEVTAIEDLRIAIDESLILLLRIGAGEAVVDPDPSPDRSVAVTIHEGASGLDVDLQLRPRPEGHFESEEGLEALARFSELVPPRVTVPTADPGGGVIRLLIR